MLGYRQQTEVISGLNLLSRMRTKGPNQNIAGVLQLGRTFKSRDEKREVVKNELLEVESC